MRISPGSLALTPTATHSSPHHIRPASDQHRQRRGHDHTERQRQNSAARPFGGPIMIQKLHVQIGLEASQLLVRRFVVVMGGMRR